MIYRSTAFFFIYIEIKKSIGDMDNYRHMIGLLPIYNSREMIKNKNKVKRKEQLNERSNIKLVKKKREESLSLFLEICIPAALRINAPRIYH